ncbi:MAG: hypothetical protein JWO38_7873 [Gemmataceae bacterium]|nr:hypothetical protein [Gemmataceae bacterium]
MFVSADRDAWGRYDAVAGRVEVHEHEQPGDVELTNLSAVGALRHGRAVNVIGPAEAALAAAFPLPLTRQHNRP